MKYVKDITEIIIIVQSQIVSFPFEAKMGKYKIIFTGGVGGRGH